MNSKAENILKIFNEIRNPLKTMKLNKQINLIKLVNKKFLSKILSILENYIDKNPNKIKQLMKMNLIIKIKDKKVDQITYWDNFYYKNKIKNNQGYLKII